MAGQVDEIEIGFTITDHPFLNYRKEDRIDLEGAYGTDILQGAFMGDVILRVPGADFSTPAPNHGWRGLVEWCLRLDEAIRALRAGAAEHCLSEPDGNDYVLIRSDDADRLNLSHSRLPGLGTVPRKSFLQAAEACIQRSVHWIGAQYPAAKRNPEATDFWARLDAYL